MHTRMEGGGIWIRVAKSATFRNRERTRASQAMETSAMLKLPGRITAG